VVNAYDPNYTGAIGRKISVQATLGKKMQDPT
jgi:hypothetical protein